MATNHSEIKFGTDGWRGVIAEEFTFANARIVAQAIARYVVRGEDARKGVLIGYDHRFASEHVAEAVAEVISSTGTPVWLADKPCPTPTISLLVRQRGAAGGIVVTASHNPYNWNGIKYKASYGSSALPSIVAQIEKELGIVLGAVDPTTEEGRAKATPLHIPRNATAEGERARLGAQAKAMPLYIAFHAKAEQGRAKATPLHPEPAEGTLRRLPPRPELIHSLEPRAPYLDTIEKLIDWNRLRERKFRFVADPMHGSAAGLLKELFTRNGVHCDEIRGNRDPLFGGVNPEPIDPHIEALRKAVVAGKYDAGFAADGDGDRIGAIDRTGAFINPHQIFSLLVWHLAGARNLPGEIAKTFSVTKLIDKLAAKLGRKLHEVPVGFKYICELMLEQNILLGGEESGGIGTSLYLPERDATVSALFLAELMAWHGKSLGELITQLHAEFGEHHYGRVDLHVSAAQKKKAIAHFQAPKLASLAGYPVVRREDLDGIKLYLGESNGQSSGTETGWLMVRASGTENVLRIYSETSRVQTTQSVLNAVAELVQAM